MNPIAQALLDSEVAEKLRTEPSAVANAARLEIEKRACEKDFATFFRRAWEVLEPGRPLDWSWHYDLLCEYLTLVRNGKFHKQFANAAGMIINIPPRSGKSNILTICFPVWCWTTNPERRFLCASYSASLSGEHSVKRRDLIMSPWFQSLWGKTFELKADVNRINQFDNDKTGQMIATSVGGSGLGRGGDTVIIDDPLSPDQAASDSERTTANNWLDNTVRNRMNDPASGLIILVMQRLNELDCTGYVLQQEPGRWTHVSIPMEAEEHERWVFPISGRVVERKPGETLQPNRYPPRVIASLKTRRLVWSGQMQQRPAPLEGNLIKRSEVRYYGGMDPMTGTLDRRLPDQFDLVLLSADCAFKDLKTSDYVAICAIGVKGPDRYILDVVNAHLDMPATAQKIRDMRTEHHASLVLVEDKANGPAVIKNLKQDIPGVIEVNPQGGKMARMAAMSGEWQSGNWFLKRDAAWCEVVIDQLISFPNASHDDVCLAAGTMIATPNGDIPIENMRDGDRVITPFGVGTVAAAGFTGHRDTIERLGLIGTPDHQIFSNGAFDALTQACMPDRLSLCSLIRWRSLKLLSLTESPIVSWEGRNGIISASRARVLAGSAQRACMLRFGNLLIKGKFQKGLKSIIAMTIVLITTILTWSAYQLRNTGVFSRDGINLVVRRCLRILNLLARLLLNGIDRKPGDGGIANTLAVSFSKTWNWCVCGVKSNSTASMRTHAFALADAVTCGGTNTIQGYQPYAPSAELSSALSTSSIRASSSKPARRIAQASDQIEQPLQGQDKRLRPVYNLRVEPDGVYYANGVLVSNCDALSQSSIYVQSRAFGILRVYAEECAALEAEPAPLLPDEPKQAQGGPPQGIMDAWAAFG